jgi:hypothetical protein
MEDEKYEMMDRMGIKVFKMKAMVKLMIDIDHFVGCSESCRGNLQPSLIEPKIEK